MAKVFKSEKAKRRSRANDSSIASIKASKKKAKKSRRTHLKTPAKNDQALWPLQRDVLFRPQRFAYIVKQKGRIPGVDACVFCEALEAGESAESLLVGETASAMVIMNKYPYNPGHVMVLPKRHVGDLLQLKDDEYADVTRLVRTAVDALKQAFNVTDFNIGMNLGKTAGAGIPEHLHIHIIPRWTGDLNFFPLIAETKVIASDMPTIYARIHPVLKELLKEQEGE